MCGICGSFGFAMDPVLLRRATDTMWHRGPDEAGYLCRDGVALGMRRLSIIDVSGGTQPKQNESGSIQIVFNGEIYNFRELRAELERHGHHLASNSDTEVIVHAYEQWGTGVFARLNGIFAVAIWDAERDRLVLGRDHLGVKPLYYAAEAGRVVFGSELKPLLTLLGRVPEIDPVSVALFLHYQYVPDQRSIFQGVWKLPPAHYLVAERGREPLLQRFWDPQIAADRKQTVTSVEEAAGAVHEALQHSVQLQMVSDVPLGAFLSGGVDSSLVVAAMQRVSNRTVQTFSIGFEESGYDESSFAAEVARHLGTDHHCWIISEEDALGVIPRLPHFYDEPFADQSAVPTYLVSQLARQHVTVSLSGDGGDELFGGYVRYGQLQRVDRWWQVPQVARVAGAAMIERALGMVAGKFRDAAASILAQPTRSDAYRNLIAITPDSRLARITRLTQDAYRLNVAWPSHHFEHRELHEAMMLTDLETYLPGAILTKVDRASMAHSLEARVPLLDPRFVELALGLPVSVRVGREPKGLLRRILRQYIPAPLVDRPKKGFGIPIHQWMRGGLREYTAGYLDRALLRRHGLLNEAGVEQLLAEHISGQEDWGYTLWALLMFQMWYEEFYLRLRAQEGRETPVMVG